LTELATISTSTLVVTLAIGVAVSVIAYRSSESFKRKRGVTPWGLPSWGWGVIGFCSLLLCGILFIIASRTTKLPMAPTAWGNGPTQAPPGWYADPGGRHEFRFWDGFQWTHRVRNGGVEEVVDS
jgi:hypothetical protein